jgi:hypothetical protein
MKRGRSLARSATESSIQQPDYRNMLGLDMRERTGTPVLSVVYLLPVLGMLRSIRKHVGKVRKSPRNSLVHFVMTASLKHGSWLSTGKVMI